MCVIIVKPKGVYLEKDLLKRAWRLNPDGAGIAYRKDNKAYFVKGLMKFGEFYNTYKALKDNELVIHFRLATSGGISKELTHPFPLDEQVDLYALQGEGTVIFHNGVLHELYSTKTSDTANLASLLRELQIAPEKLAKLLSITGSKFVIFGANFTYTVGDFEEYKGCLFSNLDFDKYAFLSRYFFYWDKI